MTMMNTDKDGVALDELRVIIERLQKLTEEATKNVGTVRPILNSSEIDLIKDHLDLVKKYIAL